MVPDTFILPFILPLEVFCTVSKVPLLGQHHAEAVMCGGMIGANPERRLELGDGAQQISLSLQSKAQIMQRIGIAGVNVNCFAKMPLGGYGISLLETYHPQVIVSVQIVGPDDKGALVVFFGFGQSSLCGQHSAQAYVRIGG